MQKVDELPDCPAKRFALNVRRLRVEKFGTVKAACLASGISVPRWYRLEQGRHPGMLGELLDAMSALFEVTPESLVKPPRKERKNGSVATGKRKGKSSDKAHA